MEMLVQAQNNNSIDGAAPEAVLVPMNLEFVKVFVNQLVSPGVSISMFSNYCIFF